MKEIEKVQLAKGFKKDFAIGMIVGLETFAHRLQEARKKK